MITKFEMTTMTYVHTSPKESISIDEALEKAIRPDMMKLILKARTKMVESMYKYFDSDLSEFIELSCIPAHYSIQGSSTGTGGQHESTCRMPLLCTVCICFVRLYDRGRPHLTFSETGDVLTWQKHGA
jgi:ferredoxin